MSAAFDKPLELFTHPLSGFCRRVQYALSFKSIPYIAIETDLLHPSADFQATSPTHEIPTLRVYKRGETHVVTQSLVIVQYLDLEFQGPPLYPRKGDGSIDWLKKAIIDCNVAKYVEGTYTKLHEYFYGAVTPEHSKAILSLLKTLNDEIVAEGKHFCHKELGEDAVNAGDIALLNLMETLDAFRETVFAEVPLGDFPNLWTWYRGMSAQPWVARNYPGNRAVQNYVHLSLTGVTPKLTLPVTVYS